ncbi:MAG: restriction endonuclease subunit S, partial [Nitrospira sp.]|nr:restriction endonuclease subunit S [Nitrospira sp.]
MSVHELSHQTKSSWRTASLNELGQLYCGQSPASSTVNTNGLGTLYVSGPEQWDGHKIRQDKWTNDPKRLVPDGCIFITVKGAGVGKIFPGIRCAIGRDVYAFKPKAELSAKFIEHAIRFTVQDVLRHAVGDIPGLSKAHILQHEIGLPEAQEQERIVAEIEKQFSRLDEAVANLKRVKANLKRYKAAVLKAAVEGKLAAAKESWKQAELGDIATSIRNGYSKKPEAERGTRIFRISAVRPMELDTNDVRYLSGTPADYKSFLVEPGDVLFTRYNGSRDYVGVCARVPASLVPTVYPDKLIRVRVPTSQLLPEFLVILASTGRAREYIESKIRTTAG